MDAREFELLRSYYAEKIDYRLKEIFSSLEDEVKKECEEEGIGQPLSSFLEDSVGYMGEFVSPTGKKDNLIRPGAKVVPPKRLRPFVGCMSYFGFGGSEEEAILNFMVGIELKHYGTLLHDDLIDKDPSRHSTKTYWNYMEEKYGEGNAHAICAGDAFIEISSWRSVP
jgi:geranylgeranyl pyrophosphate synthase